jgi:hypothetical protein
MDPLLKYTMIKVLLNAPQHGSAPLVNKQMKILFAQRIVSDQTMLSDSTDLSLIVSYIDSVYKIKSTKYIN